MSATPDKLSLNREENSEVIITVTGEYDYQVEDEVVTAKVNAEGKKRISVSLSGGITDSNGQVTFTVTAWKKKGKGNA